MGKRKVFTKTDLSVPQVEHSIDAAGRIEVLSEVMPPSGTIVTFGRNSTQQMNFDFAPWYGVDINPITYACQRQIERFLEGQDTKLETASIVSYCKSGLRHFLDYLILHSTAIRRELTLADINRAMIDGYLNHLSTVGSTTKSQRNYYTHVKSVLVALGRRGLITLVTVGDLATFPRNPFPNSNRNSKGELPLPKQQRQAFAKALKQAVMPIWRNEVHVTGEMLSYALLIVALHTGRNTTPLLEMGRDCLRTHPKNNHVFLVLWKRRGHNTSKVILRSSNDIERILESTPTITTNVESLIRRVLTLTENLRTEAPGDLNKRLWLYRPKVSKVAGQVVALTENSLKVAIQKLVTNYSLTDTNNQPLRINISRLRKTFANRIFELLDGDLETTAIALGNTPQVADRNYLVPTESSKKNWKFMGEILVTELRTRSLGATSQPTPMGHCSDPRNGQYAPKQKDELCFSFLNCLRCNHYAVTADDLYRLFSFYFRVLAERARMGKQRWAKQYAQIPRLIDDYIVAEGLRRGIFKAEAVTAAREHARREPHPFWSYDAIEALEVFS